MVILCYYNIKTNTSAFSATRKREKRLNCFVEFDLIRSYPSLFVTCFSDPVTSDIEMIRNALNTLRLTLANAKKSQRSAEKTWQPKLINFQGGTKHLCTEASF